MVSALGKLAAQAGRPLTPDAAALLEAATRAESVALQQRALEVQALLRAAPATQRAALPYDAAAEDVGVDPRLPFLEPFVQQVGLAEVWEQKQGLEVLQVSRMGRCACARCCRCCKFAGKGLDPGPRPAHHAATTAAASHPRRRFRAAQPPTCPSRTAWPWA